jgi:hypothetical protein
LLLLEARRSAADARAPVPPLRRYRLARLRLGGTASRAGNRFEYLKRAHD